MTKEAAKIHRTVRHGGSLFMPGNDEHAEKLVQEISPRAARRLLDCEAVSGSAFRRRSREHDPEPTEEAPETDAPKTKAAKAEAKTDAQKLPTGFPGRAALMAGGLSTLDAVRAATDEALIALPGVGEATTAAIREALG